MSDKKNYIRTDLAAEAVITKEQGQESGVIYDEKVANGLSVSQLTVLNEEGERQTGKSKGTYITIDIGKVWLCGASELENVINTISQEILSLINKTVSNFESILIVGLGNREIIADAVGPHSVKHVNVTRHIKKSDSNLYNMLAESEVSALTPGVVGQTGIETAEIVSGILNNTNPPYSALIVVDALAARSVDRLATTIQICDTGISPGSGIGNNRKSFNRETLGIPVIAIGVPTVVDSSTLVYDALEKAGIENLSDDLEKVLENGRSFFVSLKESDIAVEQLGTVIGKAINRALGNEFEA